MRIFIIICFALVLYSSATAQYKVNGQDEYTESIRVVKYAIEHPHSLGVSFIEKQLNRLGDGTTIALFKIYDTDALQNPQNVRNYLPIIRTAFDAPEIVGLTENRKPEITMFFLTYLEGKVSDEKLKAQISEIIKCIKEQTSSK